MFRCKDKQTIRLVPMKWFKNAWVPACTICQATGTKQEHTSNYDPYLYLPNVTGLIITEVEGGVEITWDTNSKYYTEIQVKIDDEDWTKTILAPGETESE